MMSNDQYLTNPCSHGETGVCIQCIQEDPDLDQIPGGIENENPDTTEEQGPAQQIRELALREIPPVLAERMDLAHYFLKRDDGIDHMVRRDGSSATSVTKNSDLSITIRSEIRVPRRVETPGAEDPLGPREVLAKPFGADDPGTTRRQRDARVQREAIHARHRGIDLDGRSGNGHRPVAGNRRGRPGGPGEQVLRGDHGTG